jgi:putative ABC transport system permease protein
MRLFADQPRWRKVVRDLWDDKTRTFLVSLSIAVGVFAVGMVAATRATVNRQLDESVAASNMPGAVIVTDPFSADLVQRIRKTEGVLDAEGRRSVNLRARSEGGEWRTLQLDASPDFDDIHVGKVRPESGAWPPPKETVLIERASLDYLGVAEGDLLEIEMPGGKVRRVPVAGVAYDPIAVNAAMTGQASGYAAPETLEWLGVSGEFNTLWLVAEGETYDRERTRQVAETVSDQLERGGRNIYFTWVRQNREHPAGPILNSILLLLAALGVASLALSGFLTFNTVSALLGGQLRQIGVMKSFGATRRALVGMYLVAALVFGVLALLMALPASALAALGLINYVAGFLNFDRTLNLFTPGILVLQIALGLLAPVIAALYPVLAGTRITVREAIASRGLEGGHFGEGVMDRLIERLRGFSRPFLLSLRNTFRRKGRLILTLITLALGGTVFVSVYSVRTALDERMDQAFRYWGFDVSADLAGFERTDEAIRVALGVPGVVQAEPRTTAAVRRIRSDGSESASIILTALQPQTEVIGHSLVEGRWLLPDDENAVVIDTDMAREDPDVKVGDEIHLKIEGEERPFVVVGRIRADQINIPAVSYVHINLDYYARLTGEAGKANGLLIVTDRHDPASRKQMAEAIEEALQGAGMRVAQMQTADDLRASVAQIFSLIFVFLFVMALLLAVVGGLGLMGTMSLNVLERRREIGVLRAIGAPSGAIVRIVTLEAVLIALISWISGVVLAYPVGRVLSDRVGLAFLESKLTPVFSWLGVALWLLLVVLVAVLASALPARGAARLTVREVLAYE